MTPAPLRIGKIRYLNCLPFFFGLEEKLREKGLEAGFFESHPAAINRAMQEGTIDAAPMSSLEYLQHQDDYRLIHDLGIGARGFARSVVLISKKKIEQLDHAVIALSEESLSSAGLLRILLKQKYGLTNTYDSTEQDPEAMLQKYPAALLIGDGALFCEIKVTPRSRPKPQGSSLGEWDGKSPHPLMIYKYDLATLWQEWTGKPFVFAVWAARREFAEQFSEQVHSLGTALSETLAKNLEDPQTFLKQAVGVAPADKKFCQLLGYFVSLQFNLDSEMKEGLARYFELAHQEGLAPVPKPLGTPV